jgi:hypothetical protein
VWDQTLDEKGIQGVGSDLMKVRHPEILTNNDPIDDQPSSNIFSLVGYPLGYNMSAGMVAYHMVA